MKRVRIINAFYNISIADIKEKYIVDGYDIILSEHNTLKEINNEVINEIAMVHGVDKVLQGTFGNTVTNYTDIISAQVAAFLSQYHALTSNTTQVQIELDIGSVEPLLINDSV